MSQDLSTFRFPTRPVRVLAEDPSSPTPRKGEGEDDGGEGDGRGVLSMDPPWHEQDMDEAPRTLAYDRPQRTLFHRGRNKKIALRHLDTSQKVVRLIAALEHQPEMEVEALMGALNEASQDCYQETLLSVLSAHAGGSTLEWPEPAAPAPSVPSRRDRGL